MSSGQSARDERFHAGFRSASEIQQDRRTEAQRDRDRLLYSDALRRLAGVTQIVSPSEGQVFHNRLTHTLEVGQIGRRLAERLLDTDTGKRLAQQVGGVDPDVVEAAALAHDLGHPPFGHIAEKELDDLLISKGFIDGYEGNPQSFRIVTTLATRRRESVGLDLTRATLNAILKYPWPRGTEGHHRQKWGSYASEGDQFDFARAQEPSGGAQKGAEAEIMDWADDIAYSVHDVEDFYRAGFIPLDRLRIDQAELERFLTSAFERRKRLARPTAFSEDDLAASFAALLETFNLEEPYRGTRAQRSSLKSLTSSLIARYSSALTLRQPMGSNERRVQIAPEQEMEITMLKELPWTYVIENAALVTVQYGQRRVIRDLLQIFLHEVESTRSPVIFPPMWLEHLNEFEINDTAHRTRAVVDFIASMTEQEAIKMHSRLTGVALGSVLEPYLGR